MENEFSMHESAGGLSRQESLALLAHTAETLGWAITHLSDSGMIAQTQVEGRSMQGQFAAKFEGDGLDMYSVWADGHHEHSPEDDELLRAFSKKYRELEASTSREFLQERYRNMGALLVPPGQDPFLQPPPTRKQRVLESLAFFRPSPGYVVTPLLMLANILVFVLMLLNGGSLLAPESDILIAWGANYTPLTLSGEWWRLLTNVFIHIGVLHLLMNMYALVYIGAMLEPRLGSLRFAAAYLLSGLGASLVSLWWHPVVLSAGASGAVFGMYGVFLAMLTTSLIEQEVRKSLMSSIGFFVLYNLAFGMRGGVDNAAHIGGLVTGFAIGYAFYPSLRKPGDKALQLRSVLIVLIAGIALSVVAGRNIHSDAAAFDRNLRTFSENEEKFQKLVQNPSVQTDAAYIAAFRKGLPLWEENVKLARENSNMNIPEALKTRNELLLKYSELRLQELQVAIGSANGGQRRDSLQMAIHQEANEVLKVLNKQ